MTFREILDDLLDIHGGDTGDDLEDMLKVACNRAYHRLLQQVKADDERRVFSLSTYANQPNYGLPLYVKRLLNIEYPAGERRIYDITAREFDVQYPGNDDTGEPERAYVLGSYGVQRQIATAGDGVYAVSSSASDTAGLTVIVEGFSAANVLTRETITLSGTTEVAGTGTYAVNGLQRVTRIRSSSAYTFAGNITVTDSAVARNTLAVIPACYPQNFSPTYLWVAFQPIPDAVYALTIRAMMAKRDMVNDTDWPDFDEQFHMLVTYGAAAETLPSVGKTSLAETYEQRFQKGMLAFQAAANERPSRVIEFADVTTEPGFPRRPLIEGVDF